MSIIDRITTLRLAEFPRLCHVLVHTDDGYVGLGETFHGARAVEAHIHESGAPYLLGRKPHAINRHARALQPYVGYAGTGAEMRGNSAVDIALHDLVARIAGLPVHQLLGGLAREDIRAYNTCAGYTYVRGTSGQRVENWGLPTAEPAGPYEDLDAFLHRPGELAASLLADGVTAMKIWPFDPYAEASDGTHISLADLDRGLEPFRGIRDAAGAQMDIMVELHGLWSLPAAKRIAGALEEFQPFWFEDPVRPDDLDALADFARSTRVPVLASETLGGQPAYAELLRRRAADIVMADVGWCGGIGAASRIAALAEAHSLPVTLHDCTGPVGLAASTHLSCAVPNALIQETVRAHYTSWYRELVTGLPPMKAGRIAPPPGAGLGVELRPEVFDRPDACRHTSELVAGRVRETSTP